MTIKTKLVGYTVLSVLLVTLTTGLVLSLLFANQSPPTPEMGTIVFQTFLNQIPYLLVIVTLFSVVLGGASYFFYTRNFSSIETIVGMLNDIADGEGDLTQRLPEGAQGELTSLTLSFNKFLEKIQEIIKDISADSETLSAASEELSSSSVEMKTASKIMSSAIAAEAAATQQTLSTITNMVNSLEGMFKKIKDIQNRAHEAENVAQQGNRIVDETIQTMANIESSTKEIGGVVNVITDISNQTNLLSLNAAIEAAKAGESGKGFAVVADEVRSLAEKSSASVVEIKKLVDASANNVSAGANIIQETQSMLEQIINQVQEISQYLQELTKEITEQENGIIDVSHGVEAVSQLSGENAEMVEQLSGSVTESSQTADELSMLAEHLMQKVNQFHT